MTSLARRIRAPVRVSGSGHSTALELQVNRDWSSHVPGPFAFGATRLLLQGPGSVALVDSLTGRLVAPPLYGLADDPRAQLSPDERRFAVVAADPDLVGRSSS